MPKPLPDLIPGEGDDIARKNAARWLAMLDRAADLLVRVQQEIDGTNPEGFDWIGREGPYDRTGWPLLAGLSQDLDRIASGSGDAGGDSLDQRIRDLVDLVPEADPNRKETAP